MTRSTDITANLDTAQVAIFDRHSDQWWDPDGPLHTLHVINPVRLRYIDAAARLRGRAVLDVGCGGGLLGEAMARRGAHVTGVDASLASIHTAQAHATLGNLSIEYVHGTVEDLAATGRRFEVITCMELLEHVPDPDSVIECCARMLTPGGDLILSTVNRNLKSWLGAIVAVEYLLRIVPKGTHTYEYLLRPSEVRRMLERHGLDVTDMVGVHYLPWLDRCSLRNDPGINYMVHARKAANP